MLTLRSLAAWSSNASDSAQEASRCLMEGPASFDVGREGSAPNHGVELRASAPSSVSSFACEPSHGPPLEHSNWLRRIGSVDSRESARGRLSNRDKARHAILAWRLERPYLVYSLACAFAMALLLVWNIVKGVQNNWNLPQWKHHRWEEALEVGIGAVIVVETLLTLRVLGVRTFFTSYWCLFDLLVTLLTVVSIGYGIDHLGRSGEICQAEVPLLTLRFVLQPARVLAALVGAWRTRRMQMDVEELRVDFGTLSAGGGANFEAMQELC
ncbi:unnamed protein product [Polarella glacialis]|uniref:Ion transport domain-containing protein n=1 Tax=Polarella glacialis TaxID=89957 RepID=A0A813KWI5_POLGL|nr:unnamed protein product [Polarella glacialis]